MAGKESGLGARFFVGGYDLSGDTAALDSISSPRGVLDMTGIDKFAMERILSTKDGEMSWTAFFNPDSNQAHPVLSALPQGDVGVLYGHRATLAVPAAAMVGKEIDYAGSRGSDGSFTFKASVLANGYGLEWGKLLTAGARTDTAATAGASVDFGSGSTAFGLQAYLQVLAFTGTDATVKLQESSDNGVGDAWTDVTAGGFAQVTTGRQTQRLQTSRTQTVERYLRVTTTTSGGFSSLAFAVMVSRNIAAVNF